MKKRNFKIWDNRRKEWVYDGSYSVISIDTSGNVIKSSTESCESPISYDHYDDGIVVESTGFKYPGTEQEIFEGDVFSESGAYVVWNEKLGGWGWKLKDIKHPEYLLHNQIKFARYISNIFDNPEYK